MDPRQMLMRGTCKEKFAHVIRNARGKKTNIEWEPSIRIERMNIEKQTKAGYHIGHPKQQVKRFDKVVCEQNLE